MKASAIAPANIAFIKYWGKADPITRVPQNNSVSMNLSDMYTTTTVEFSETYDQDSVSFVGEKVTKDHELRRVSRALDLIREKAGSNLYAKVVTKNTFPKATGIASSASGFASLAVAGFRALDVSLEEKELSLFCRALSGTACRSIPDGFVEWVAGSGPDDSFGKTIFDVDHWNICDVVAIVTTEMKKVSSTDGHAIADTSPFYEARMSGLNTKLASLKEAMRHRNFESFGRIIEAEALNMHAICLTSTPSLLYWSPTTVAVMKRVTQARQDGLACYYTIDAGPSVHVICSEDDSKDVLAILNNIEGVERAVVNRPCRGAHVSEEHLF